MGQKAPRVASNVPSMVGGKSDAGDVEIELTGKSLVEAVKNAPQTFRVMLPMRDKAGKIIGNTVVRMKLAEGQTTSDALKLARKMNRELQQRTPSKTKLFEPA